MDPVVTVVMTVYDGRPHVAAAIGSILSQTFGDLELVVVDDGSRDGSPEEIAAVADPRLVVVANAAHAGRTACLNQAVALARGRYVAVMDADDLALPRRLEVQVAHLDAHPDVDLVGGAMIMLDERGVARGVGPPAAGHDELTAARWRGIPLAHPTWCGRRSLFERFAYARSMTRGEDQELLHRASWEARFESLPDTVLVKRERDVDVAELVSNRARHLRSVLRADIAARRWRGAAIALAGTAGDGVRLLTGRRRPTWQVRPVEEGDAAIALADLVLAR